MKKTALALSFSLLIAASGCKSMTSTALNRHGNDMFSRDCHPVNGVPIRIKVPSHLQVHITETYLLQKKGEEWVPVALPQPLLNLGSNLRYTDKIFTVDFKRPAAGTSKYSAEFDSDSQYFSKIAHELEDKTIKETSEAIGNLIGAVSKAAKGASITAPVSNANVITGERSVAWAEFDINEPDFEENVRAFVQEHLNCCHACQNPPWSATAKYPEFAPGANCLDGICGPN